MDKGDVAIIQFVHEFFNCLSGFRIGVPDTDCPPINLGVLSEFKQLANDGGFIHYII